jgi:cytolysin-activating lysine-acyltransferase
MAIRLKAPVGIERTMNGNTLNTDQNREPPLDTQDMRKLAEAAKQQAQLVLKKIPMLGAVSWLLMQQASTRHILLSDLEWRVMPALLLDQAKLYMREDVPIAFVSWARLSPEVAERYASPPHQLRPTDWTSGDQYWLTEVVTPFGGAREIFDDLRRAFLPVRWFIRLARRSRRANASSNGPPWTRNLSDLRPFILKESSANPALNHPPAPHLAAARCLAVVACRHSADAGRLLLGTQGPSFQ